MKKETYSRTIEFDEDHLNLCAQNKSLADQKNAVFGGVQDPVLIKIRLGILRQSCIITLAQHVFNETFNDPKQSDASLIMEIKDEIEDTLDSVRKYAAENKLKSYDIHTMQEGEVGGSK